MQVEELIEAIETKLFSRKSQPRPRLKKPVNLGALMTERSTELQIEQDESAEMDFDDDDAFKPYDFLASVSKEKPLLAKKSQIKSKAFEKFLQSDFISGTFSEMAENMVALDPEGSIKKQIIKTGSGDLLVPKDGVVAIHYVAIAEGGDEPFDSSTFCKTPAIYDLRTDSISMLPAFYHALLSMKVGEVSKFIVKSSQAYGKLGLIGLQVPVPPNSDVMYFIEVLQIIEPEILSSRLLMNAEERAKLPFQNIMKHSEDLRLAGNLDYSGGEFLKAVKKYKKALMILEDYPVLIEADEKARAAAVLKLYSNLAQCFLKLEMPKKACIACKLGLKSGGGKTDAKLLYRYAKAKLELKDHEGVKELCKKALALNPNDNSFLVLKCKADEEAKKERTSSMNVFRGMLS